MMPESGIATQHGLAAWLALMVGLVLLFHFTGFRFIVAAGRAV